MAQSTPQINSKEMEVGTIVSKTSTIGTDATAENNPKLHRGAAYELEIVKGDDATSEGTRSLNKVQLNVKNAVIGTNGTQSNNVKLHRGGNSEIGFVQGDDTEAEGSRSNNHALLQAKSLVLGDSPNQSFNVKLKRSGNGIAQLVLGDDTYGDGVFSPNYADLLGSVPVGTVVAWNPGYYLDASNGAFVNADFLPLNNIAGANSYLNLRGYFVADGSVPSITGSLIWNAAGRYLPNLTDDRFLMGSTSCGGIGGTNLMLDHTHSSTLSVDAHTHSIDHDHVSVDSGDNDNDPSRLIGGQTYGFLEQSGTGLSWYETSLHTHPVDMPSYSGTSGAASSSSISGTIGSGSASSATENRPKYLGTFFIVRVF